MLGAEEIKRLLGGAHDDGPDTVDDALAEFVAAALEGKACEKPADVEDLVGDLLMGYGLADEDEEVAALCAALHAGLAPPAAAPAAAVADDRNSNDDGDDDDDKDKNEVETLARAVCIADAPAADDGAPPALGGTAAAAAAAAAARGGRKRVVLTKKERRAQKKREQREQRRQRRSSARSGGSSDEQGGGSDGEEREDDEKRRLRLEHALELEREEVADDTIVGVRGRLEHGGGSSRDVVISGLNVSAGGAELLANAKLRLQWGCRYGLVGINGCGKSTLMRRLARGQIRGLPHDFRVAYAAQEAAESDQSAVDYVVSGDEELARLNAEFDRLVDAAGGGGGGGGDPARLEKVTQRLDALEAHTAAERAAALLSGLQVRRAMRERPVRELSGGWRMRVSLARALFARGDLLLLDEPTNHLDLEGILFLEEYLRESFGGTVCVVSHDRAFLNAVADETIHLTRKELRYYPGNYDSFEAQTNARRLHKQRTQDNLDRHRAHMQDTVRRLESTARKSNDQKRLAVVAARRRKMLRMGVEKHENGKRWRLLSDGFRVGSARMNASHGRGNAQDGTSIVEAPDPELHFKFPEPAPLPAGGGDAVLRLDGARFAYPGEARDVLRDVTVGVPRGARIAVLGPNGSGKTTLLRLLTGEAEPGAGKAKVHPYARIARFTQHHQQQLDLAATPLEHMQREFPLDKEADSRKKLGAFGIGGRMALRPMATLSGGQLTRVVLATVTASGPNVLVLDEPSNHLDFQSVEALVEALAAFEGVVVLVSHDRHLVAEVATETWLVDGGAVRRWDGGVDAYCAHVEKKRAARRAQ